MASTVNLATVHWRDPRWIVPQGEAIARHFRRPVRVFANLEGIDGYDENFYRTNREGGEHATKLNTLAQQIADEANADDIVVFLDGDAFPVRPMDDWIDDLLAGAPLAAIQRLDNAGDIQPHPCFCVTTVGFWKKIQGDWRRGPMWTNANGVQITDVGATLMAQLNDRNINWKAIHRSNVVNLHPLMFGVYGEHIYHHGAGFRSPILRIDGSDLVQPYLDFRERVRSDGLSTLRPRDARHLYRAIRGRVRGRKILARSKHFQEVSRELFDEVKTNPRFFERFERFERSKDGV